MVLQINRSGGEVIVTVRFTEVSGGLQALLPVPVGRNPPEFKGDVAVEGDLEARLLHPLSLLSSNPFGINSLLKRDLRVDRKRSLGT